YDRYVERENQRISKPTEIVNVVGILPGTQLESKDRMYVVSGHYDSRVSNVMNDTSFAPGADDDASGTAAVMELARVMSKHEFDATVIFLAVAGEEQGLLGSNHFAEMAKTRNMNIAAMFTNDIIGNSVKNTDGSVHDDFVRVFAQGIPPKKELSRNDRMLLVTGGENDTPTRELGRFIYRVAQNQMPGLSVDLIYRKDRYLRGGDHSSFLDEGYPAVRFSEPHENFDHQHQDVRTEDGIQYGDLPKFVDYNYVAKVTRLNAASLMVLANAPAEPKDVGVVVSELTNNTTLKWAPNNEPDLKGYEIVWRNTHQPYWEHLKFVGDTTRYTVKGVSKDNYVFGVRSVDKYGNESPAVYPLPVRN
ncbi:MAG: M28 family metallopeptidase, partial [Balneolaceae bacterium]